MAAPLLVLWLFESAITAWLNKPPREERHHLSVKEREFLHEMALRTWRFFYEYGGAAHNYLVPDNVEEHELFEAARVSPTNFGLLLNARQAAHTFGYLTAPEFVTLSHAAWTRTTAWRSGTGTSTTGTTRGRSSRFARA